MNKTTSLYLDFLRVLAAVGVLFDHASVQWVSSNLFLPPEMGHKFVMIFFVLSGYLIAFTVDQKNKGPRKYLIDRFSRLYSVILPALVFTYLVDAIGSHLNAVFYIDKLAPDHQIFRFLLNATFLQQIWSLSTKPSTNGAFWSLSYEFWYYILFWAFHYFHKGKKWMLLLFICLLIGIKILLLLPIWVFGVLAYRYSKKLVISTRNGAILFCLSLFLIVMLSSVWDFSVFSQKFVIGQPPLYFSSCFVFDWIYGFLVAINIFSFTFITFSYKIPTFLFAGIKYLSSITFSLYLFHGPILHFAAAIIPYNKSSYIQVLGIIICIVLITAFIAEITEKQRSNWKLLFQKIFLRNESTIQ